MDETGKLVERLRKYGGNRAVPGYYGGYAPSELYHKAADTIERLERLRVAYPASDELVEAVAPAICDAEAHEAGAVGYRSCLAEGPLCRQGAIAAKCDAFKMARAALDAIQKFGAGETRD